METIVYPTENGTFNGTVCTPGFNVTSCTEEINKTYCETLKNETLCITLPPPSTLQTVLNNLLTVTVAIVMVGMGCGVEFQKIKEHLKKPTGVIVGFFSQFVIMPAIAFGLAKIFQMPDLHALCLLIVGSCPGGSTSNIVAYWINGDLDLSITMTTISSILSLGVMPLLLFIYSLGFSSGLEVPFEDIGITLALLIGPILLGLGIGYKFPRYAPKIVKFLSAFGIVAIIVVSVLSIVTFGVAISLTTEQALCAAIFPIVGMSLGYIFSSLVSLYRPLYLHHYQRRTISLETGVQNTQVASAIILRSGFTFIQLGQIIFFPAIYVLGQLTWVVVLLILYRLYLHFHKKKNVSENLRDDYDSEQQKDEAKVQTYVNYNEAYDSSFDKDLKDTGEKTSKF